MRNCLHSLSRALGWLLAGLMATGLARAQAVASQSEFAQLEQMAREWVQPALASVTGPDGGGALRPEILFGSLDSRLKLTPCTHIEP